MKCLGVKLTASREADQHCCVLGCVIKSSSPHTKELSGKWGNPSYPTDTNPAPTRAVSGEPQAHGGWMGPQMSQGKQLSRSALQTEEGHCLQEQGTCTCSLVSPIQLVLDPPRFLTFTLLHPAGGKWASNWHVSTYMFQPHLHEKDQVLLAIPYILCLYTPLVPSLKLNCTLQIP